MVAGGWILFLLGSYGDICDGLCAIVDGWKVLSGEDGHWDYCSCIVQPLCSKEWKWYHVARVYMVQQLCSKGKYCDGDLE